jgi:cathepsin F
VDFVVILGWAFSATGAIASQRAMHGGALEELSVEQYLDCDALDCSVFGGWPYLAYEYAINAGGLNSESDYPYCAGFGKCYPCMPNKNTTFCGPPPSYCNRTCLAVPNKFVVSVSKWTQIPVNDSAIENALLTYGPLSVLINAETLQLHSGSGIWKPLFCDPDALDHAVLLIGYGEETTILGKTERYWLIANSWVCFLVLQVIDDHGCSCGHCTNVIVFLIGHEMGR